MSNLYIILLKLKRQPNQQINSHFLANQVNIKRSLCLQVWYLVEVQKIEKRDTPHDEYNKGNKKIAGVKSTLRMRILVAKRVNLLLTIFSLEIDLNKAIIGPKKTLKVKDKTGPFHLSPSVTDILDF